NKLGAALLSWGEFDKAEIALSQAVAANPNEPEPYFRLGQLFREIGDRDRARAMLETYLQLAPDGPWAAEARQLLQVE
ncbi:MAG: tetratricopeptide repeat protein, partial [Chloroflexia bacterium]|nr:tetratricopeptide repeat protein [Chloroflexia bacterium]